MLIKPASSACNLQCKYCFYHASANTRSAAPQQMMSYETASVLIEKAVKAASEHLYFLFQGGEPLLRGLEFYRFFVDRVQKERATKPLQIHYALQTNGALLDEEWCRFFKDKDFLLGVSLDGTPKIHDYLRDAESGSYRKTLSKIKLLEKHGVPFNILCVVGKSAAKKPKAVYTELRRQGFEYLQFIACLDDPAKKTDSYASDAAAYGNFLVETYRLYQTERNAGRFVSIRLFDNILRRLQGMPAELCGFSGHCSIQLVTEANGTVFPCDFYCNDDQVLGNILTDSIEDLLTSPRAVQFLEEGKLQAADCLRCRFAPLCGGGCKREHHLGKSRFCQSYRILFEAMGL